MPAVAPAVIRMTSQGQHTDGFSARFIAVTFRSQRLCRPSEAFVGSVLYEPVKGKLSVYSEHLKENAVSAPQPR